MTTMRCEYCRGFGHDPNDPEAKTGAAHAECPVCEGTGEVSAVTPEGRPPDAFIAGRPAIAMPCEGCGFRFLRWAIPQPTDADNSCPRCGRKVEV